MCLLCVCLSLLFLFHYPALFVFVSGLFSVPHSLCPRFSLSGYFSFFLSLLDRTAAHKDVCFLEVDEDLICTVPHRGAVTYSECCCYFGHGWGPECRTCPQRNTGGLKALLLKSYKRYAFALRNSGKLTAILLKSYRGRTFPPQNSGKLPAILLLKLYNFLRNPGPFQELQLVSTPQ